MSGSAGNFLFWDYLPEPARSYCCEIWENYPHKLILAPTRRTKLGDFRYRGKRLGYSISINRDLSPGAFLLTYLHELAHRIVWEQHGRRVAPHGKEWKGMYRKLAVPMLNAHIFDQPTLQSLKEYFQNPQATIIREKEVYRSLYLPADSRLLGDLSEEEYFCFQGREFQLIKKNRTRAVCLEPQSKRRYLISLLARIN